MGFDLLFEGASGSAEIAGDRQRDPDLHIEMVLGVAADDLFGSGTEHHADGPLGFIDVDQFDVVLPDKPASVRERLDSKCIHTYSS